MQRYRTLSVPGDLSIQASQIRCDREANGADRLSPRRSCSKTSQSASPMAPVIVTQIHAAVNRRHVKDQGLFSVRRGRGEDGGGTGTEEKKVYQRLA